MKQFNCYKQKLFFYLSIAASLLLIISCRGSSKLDNSHLSNVPVDVYVGGYSYSSQSVACYWKNGEMVPLSTKYWKNDEKKPRDSTERSRVNSIAVIDGDIYAGGYYIKYDFSLEIQAYGTAEYEVRVACYWKNGKLVSLTYSKYGSEVNSIFICGNDVYAGGFINNRKAKIGGYWKNGKWVGLSNAKNSSMVNSIFVSGDDVYACGNSGGPCYWKNGKWIALPYLDEKKKTFANSIFVSGNDIYICGYAREDFGIYVAGYWKNGEIIPLLPFAPNYNPNAVSIFVSGNDVYVGGYCYNSRFPTVAGYWKNGKWIALTPIDNKERSQVASIFVFGNDVYAGGYSGDIPGYWKNGEWVGFNAKGGVLPVSSIVVVPRP
ncbi:MAG: hypothetical protein FWF73_00100 [Spirochaetes bacterium]|nr:hypothetical protein [Spirochaetota bacterium]